MWPLLYESFGKRSKDFDRLVVVYCWNVQYQTLVTLVLLLSPHERLSPSPCKIAGELSAP